MTPTLPADARPVPELLAALADEVDGNTELRHASYALIGGLICRGAPTAGALAYTLACIAQGLTDVALDEVTR